MDKAKIVRLIEELPKDVRNARYLQWSSAKNLPNYSGGDFVEYMADRFLAEGKLSEGDIESQQEASILPSSSLKSLSDKISSVVIQATAPTNPGGIDRTNEDLDAFFESGPKTEQRPGYETPKAAPSFGEMLDELMGEVKQTKTEPPAAPTETGKPPVPVNTSIVANVNLNQPTQPPTESTTYGLKPEGWTPPPAPMPKGRYIGPEGSFPLEGGIPKSTYGLQPEDYEQPLPLAEMPRLPNIPTIGIKPPVKLPQAPTPTGQQPLPGQQPQTTIPTVKKAPRRGAGLRLFGQRWKKQGHTPSSYIDAFRPRERVEDIGQGLSSLGGNVGNAIGGPWGAAIGGVSKFVGILSESVGKLRQWNDQLLESNLKFAEFSGAMAGVAARQEVRDIQLSKERGDRRAAAAEEQARGRFALEKEFSVWEDSASNLFSKLMGDISKDLAWYMKSVRDPVGAAKDLWEALKDPTGEKKKKEDTDFLYKEFENWENTHGRPKRF